MARIRSIKPEFRTSLTATQWPREIRLFFALLWGYLDDHGYGVDEPRLIKPDCFPMDDDLTPGDIDKWMDIIARDGSLCRFTGPDGRRYVHAPNWADHQRPQHPAMPRFPACTRSHESLMNESHETLMNGSGESHQPNLASSGQIGVSAGKHASGDSHETLTPEGERRVVEQGGGGGGVVALAREPRTRAAATLLGNAILDEHRRLVKPSLPRDVARRVGEQIDLLLDDPEISPDEVRQGLAKLRANPKLGPGILSSLVNEIRQLAAHPELDAGRASPRQRAEEAHRNRAMQRAIEREGAGQ